MRRSWRRRIMLTAVAIVVIETLMILTSMGPRLLVVTALGLLAAASVWLATDVNDVAARAEPRHSPRQPGDMLGDRRVSALRHGLTFGQHDSNQSRRLRETLVELVDDELAAGHGIDRLADPAAAAGVMGDELARFVDRDDSSVMSHGELTRFVTLIEAL